MKIRIFNRSTRKAFIYYLCFYANQVFTFTINFPTFNPPGRKLNTEKEINYIKKLSSKKTFIYYLCFYANQVFAFNINFPTFKPKDTNNINPIRSRGGGQYCPPDLWQALHQKLEKPATWIFLTIPKYVCICFYSTELAERGFKLAGQDILCIFLTNWHFLWCIISILSY